MIDAHDLEYALLEMIETSLKADAQEVAFGHPCSALIARAAVIGVEELAAQLIRNSSEYRLNGAGLKLYVHRGYVSIGGDQEGYYVGTVTRMNNILRRRGLLRP